MKKLSKLLAVLLAAVLVLGCSSALADKMIVHITALCWDTNHVGTQWEGYYSIGGMQVFDGDLVDLKKGSYTFYTEIGDYESSPDVGSVETDFNVTSTRLKNGFSVEQYLTVTEDRGSYKGYWCEWFVYYDFIPVGTATVLH